MKTRRRTKTRTKTSAKARKNTRKNTSRTPTASADDRSIVLQRVFDAPRDVVFAAWTDPKHLDAWMGPDGFRTTTSSMKFRVGGTWIYTMAHAEYGTFPNRVTYREIVAPERIVYLHDSGSDDDPAGFETTVTFEEQGARTLLTMRSVLPSIAELERVKAFGAVEGGRQTLARLAAHLRA
jgi:uncharacterized protein YndB with AHSA1/START domain